LSHEWKWHSNAAVHRVTQVEDLRHRGNLGIGLT
jgi:hypothetical protein